VTSRGQRDPEYNSLVWSTEAHRSTLSWSWMSKRIRKHTKDRPNQRLLIHVSLMQYPWGWGWRSESGAEGRAGARKEDGQQRARTSACAGHQRGVQGAGSHVSAAPEEREAADQAAGAASGRVADPQHGATSPRSVFPGEGALCLRKVKWGEERVTMRWKHTTRS